MSGTCERCGRGPQEYCETHRDELGGGWVRDEDLHHCGCWYFVVHRLPTKAALAELSGTEYPMSRLCRHHHGWLSRMSAR